MCGRKVEGEVSISSEVWLKGETSGGQLLSARFMPSKGMNLVSLKKGECEAIDQLTKPLFEERYAGLGAMIGPHFHHRLESEIQPVKNASLFPQTKGLKESFSHGIGR